MRALYRGSRDGNESARTRGSTQLEINVYGGGACPKTEMHRCMTREDILKDVGIPLFDHEYPIRVRYLCTYVPMMNSNFSDASDEKRFTLRI